jgi:hypothetical protein
MLAPIDRGGSILERLESRHQDIGQHQKSLTTTVVLIEAAQDSTGQNLAQIGASDIDSLMMSLE